MSRMYKERNLVQNKDAEPRVNELTQKFLVDLEEERQRLQDNFPICSLLISEAIENIYGTGRIPGREYYADVYNQKPIKISQKVYVPSKQYPKFNFAGKILGPKGNSLRRLQEETQCKIAIKGRNSVRDAAKKEDMLNSSDPRYAHLNKSLHVEISTSAPPAECYARVAYALAEIRKYLVPDKNDEVSHEQMRELMEIDPKSVKISSRLPGEMKRSIFDREFAGTHSGGPRFLRRTREPDELEEDEEEVYEYEERVPKRSAPPVYKYTKVPSTSSRYERSTASPDYPPKRIRENPVKSYKPITILKKFK